MTRRDTKKEKRKSDSISFFCVFVFYFVSLRVISWIKIFLPAFAAFGQALRLLDFAHSGGGFAAAFVAGLFVMFMGAGFLEDAAFHRLLFEAPQRRVYALAGLDRYLCQIRSFLSCWPGVRAEKWRRIAAIE